MGKLESAAQKRRLYGFLARRGYDSNDIQRVLALLLAADVTESE